MPALPSLPPLGEYMPEMPQAPSVELPEPFEGMKQKMIKFDHENVSPLIKNINYIMVILSILGLVGLSDFLMFKPNKIISIIPDSKSSFAGWQVPHLWTLITSIFIE